MVISRPFHFCYLSHISRSILTKKVWKWNVEFGAQAKMDLKFLLRFG